MKKIYVSQKISLKPPEKRSVSNGVNLLAIDASTENISLCISSNGITLDFNRRISFGASKLITYIEKNLKKADLSLNEIDAFVLGSGPGSFTGLRISFAIVKAITMATKKPVIAMSSFLSCALQCREVDKRIAVIADARRNLFYCGYFEYKDGNLKQEKKVQLVNKDQLPYAGDYLVVTYDGALRDSLLKEDNDMNFYRRDVYPRAKDLLILAKSYYNQKRFTPLDKLEPLYLHPKTCQIRKK